MKLATVDLNITSSVPQKGSFKITASPKAFKILSSGLYSDKILAVVRELSTNAYDAHASVGKQDLPFEIHMPSLAEPWFSVEDFGCGMDEQLVDDTYTTYFGSTKAETNAEAGFMGLGSKSPFSYTDSFTVQTICNGKKLVYTMALGPTGEPTPHLMINAETDQANGTKVTVPVDRYDINRFIEAAQKSFRAFAVKPIVYGVEYHIVAQIVAPQQYVFKNDVYGIRVKDTDHPFLRSQHTYAIQGPVGYKLNLSDAEVPNFGYCNFENLDIFFPIGQLDPTASRESLSYDSVTKANITAMVNVIEDRLFDDMQDYINGASNLYEAHIRAKLLNDNGAFKCPKMPAPKYNGQVIRNWGSYFDFPDPRMMNGFAFYASKLKKTRKSIRVEHSAITNKSIQIVEDVPYFFNDLGKKGNAIYKNHVKTSGIQSSFLFGLAPGFECVIGEDARECMNWIIDQLPGMTFIPLSTIPVVKVEKKVREKSTGLPTTKEWKYITNNTQIIRGRFIPRVISEVDAATMSANMPRIFITSLELDNYKLRSIAQAVSAECEISGLPNNVYVLTKSEYNLAMKGSVVWIHAKDFLESMITETHIKHIQEFNAHMENNAIFDEIHWCSTTRADSILLKMLGIKTEQVHYALTSFERKLRDIKDAVSLIDQSICDRLYKKSPAIPKVDVSDWNLFLKEAPAKYPMLKFIDIKASLGKPAEQDIVDYIALIEAQENV